MSVDKIELLKRYKELKAQGKNVSLSELKAQMEAESNQSSEPVYNEPVQTTSNTVNNVNYNSNAEQNTSTESSNFYSNPVNSLNSQVVQNGIYNNSDSSNSGWSTTYSNVASVSTPESYSYSVSNNQTNSVQEKYTGNYTPSSQIIEKAPYTGNISVNSNVKFEESEKKKFALIGYPLGHSLSEYIHDAGFKSLGIDASYEILETPPEKLVDRIKFLKFNNYSGFNVTIPLKLPVTMFLNEVDASAGLVNAVNTVVIDKETKELKGYNTDVIGFKNAIPQDVTLCGKTAGVLGTGGAARAAITALVQSQVDEIKLFTRNVPNSFEFLEYLRKTFPNVEFNSYQIERIRDLSDIQILVNTTPIGMLGRAADLTPVEERELCTLPQGAVVYDVIYNPKKTLLLKLAQKNGYKTINGVDMFIHQALAAEQIWTGRTPDFKDMKIAALENL